jgi:hypothetical protein
LVNGHRPGELERKICPQRLAQACPEALRCEALGHQTPRPAGADSQCRVPGCGFTLAEPEALLNRSFILDKLYRSTTACQSATISPHTSSFIRAAIVGFMKARGQFRSPLYRIGWIYSKALASITERQLASCVLSIEEATEILRTNMTLPPASLGGFSKAAIH